MAHYIKCLGDLRGDGVRCVKDSCANKFLKMEIESVKPKVVMGVGANASRFLLKMTHLRKDWRNLFWEEISSVVSGKLLEPPIISGARILVFMHPSGTNPIGHYFNMKLQPLLLKTLESPIHKSINKEKGLFM